MTESETKQEIPAFSLVQGGPLFQLWRRLKLSGNELEFVERRVIATVVIVWLPLLILSLIDGHAFGNSVKMPFIADVMAHARFLVGISILVGGELLVHRRIGSRIKNFLRREIIVGQEIPKFRAAIESANRMRDSVFLEIGLLLLVYTVGLWFWSSQIILGTPTWYATPNGASMNVTLAGYWLAFVSVPMFQFFLLRYYLRLGIWCVFLWRVSRLKLHLVVTHPDRAGGLGFLGKCTYASAPLLLAQGALLSGHISNQVLYNGQNLMDFRVEAAAFVLFFTAAVFCPLLVFAATMNSEKQRGLSEYGEFASLYGREFEQKWIEGDHPESEELLGTGDIQSLADLGNSYSVIQEMNFAPFGLKDLIRVGAASVLPLLPLSLLILSPGEILDQILKVLF